MTINLLEQAINCDDGDRAAKMIRDALGIESDDVTNYCFPKHRWPWATDYSDWWLVEDWGELSGPIALMDENRLELLIAALIGVLLGVITGIALGYGPIYTFIWALIGAVVVGELVYWLRAFR
jgi:hypothetical protein